MFALNMTDFRRGYVIELTDEDRQVASRKLGEEQHQVPSQINSLRAWLKQQQHMQSRTDDDFLLAFLRRAKFSQTLAREMLEEYTKIRVTEPFKEIYLNSPKLDPGVSELILSGVAFILPGLPKSGIRTLVFRQGDIDTSKYTFQDGLRAANVCIDICLLDPYTQIYGLKWIADHKNTTLSLLRSITRHNLSMAAASFIDCPPFQFKGAHHVNTNLISSGILMVLRACVSSAKASLINDDGTNMTLLHRAIDGGVLPVEYGGTDGTVLQQAARWHDHVLKNVERLGMFRTMSYDQSLKNKDGD